MGNSSKILRVHGPFVDDKEVEKVTNFLRASGIPEYVSAVTESSDDEMLNNEGGESVFFSWGLSCIQSSASFN